MHLPFSLDEKMYIYSSLVQQIFREVAYDTIPS